MITERAFDTGEIGRVHPGLFGELLLGLPLGLAHFARPGGEGVFIGEDFGQRLMMGCL
jgi:hypothetical protein